MVRRGGAVFHHADFPDSVRQAVADDCVGDGGRGVVVAVSPAAASGAASATGGVEAKSMLPRAVTPTIIATQFVLPPSPVSDKKGTASNTLSGTGQWVVANWKASTGPV